MRKLIYKIMEWAIAGEQLRRDKELKKTVVPVEREELDPSCRPVSRYQFEDLTDSFYRLNKQVRAVVKHLGLTFEDKGLQARELTAEEKKRSEVRGISGGECAAKEQTLCPSTR